MGISFFEAMQRIDEITSIGKAGEKLRNFALMIMMFRTKLQHGTLEDLITDVIETTQYTKELEESEDDDAEDRLQNIDELISKTEAYQEAGEERGEPATLSGFLEEIALIADIDSVDPDQDYVLLMTLHSAKGLEFPNVFLVGMEDGIFPSYMSIMSDDCSDLEEERRLCYVGITRAMKELTMTSARQRMIRGDIQYNKVSRFVREVPRELVDLGYKVEEKKPKISESLTGDSSLSKMKQVFAAKPFQATQFKVTKADSLDYQIGDTVRHVKFGVGVVKNIVEGGRDYEVTVDFDKVGVKKMFAGFAKLKKI